MPIPNAIVATIYLQGLKRALHRGLVGKIKYRDIHLFHEPILNFHSLLRAHTGVIGQGSKSTFRQLHGDIFGLLENST